MKHRKRKIIIPIAICLSGLCFGSYWGSMNWLKINQFTVALSGLPEHMDGFRILQITDLHNSSRVKMDIDIWAEIEKSGIDFDVAVITGDMTRHGIMEEMNPHEDGLRSLAARAPTYFVDGNHEKYIYEETVRWLADLGIPTLPGKSVDLWYNGGPYRVTGTRDWDYLKRKNFDGLEPLFHDGYNGFRLTLTHQPQIFDLIKQYSPGLVLAGHTHGGQVRLPFLPVLYAPRQGIFPKYGYGFYEYGNSNMFVSKGIGTTVFPIRFYNRPEITVFTLKKAP